MIDMTVLHIGIEPYLDYIILFFAIGILIGIGLFIWLLVWMGKGRARETDEYLEIWSESLGLKEIEKESSNRKFKGDYRGCRLSVRLDLFQERLFIRVTPGGEVPEIGRFEDAKLPGLRVLDRAP